VARFDLSEKVALVAGASRGIGEAVARGLSQHGATVICSSRKQADCEKVAESIRENGGKAISAELHLGELSHHGKVVEMIAKEYGRLDILINNGATNPYFGPAHEAPVSAYDKTMDVNVKGPYYLSAKDDESGFDQHDQRLSQGIWRSWHSRKCASARIYGYKDRGGFKG